MIVDLTDARALESRLTGGKETVRRVRPTFSAFLDESGLRG